MALMWADGFDHYGGITARLLDGVYSQIEGVALSAANPRTGGYAMRVSPIANNSGARRVLPAETTKVGFGYAFNLSALPTDTKSLMLGQFLTKENTVILTITVYPTGAVAVRQGGWQGTLLNLSGPEVIMPGSYQHFECSLDDSNLEIRVNGVTVINMTSLPILPPTAQIFVAGGYGYPKGGALVTMDVDDLFCRDASGATVNSWVGDKKVYTRMPDEDGPDQDWTPSVGSEAWPILDNVPPIDSQFVTATTVGDKTSVGFAAFSSDIVSIAAVYVAARLWKTDAGNAKVSVDMVSGLDDTANDPKAISNAPRWYGQVFEVDPATAMPWTIADLNASMVRLERKE